MGLIINQATIPATHAICGLAGITDFNQGHIGKIMIALQHDSGNVSMGSVATLAREHEQPGRPPSDQLMGNVQLLADLPDVLFLRLEGVTRDVARR